MNRARPLYRVSYRCRPFPAILVLGILPLIMSCDGGDEVDQAKSSDPAGQTVPQAAGDIENFLNGYYDALSDRDWQRFAEQFHDGAHIAFVMPDSTGYVPGVTFQSVAEFVSLAPLGPGSREIFEERMTSHTIHLAGDLAMAWVGYEARFGDPGDVFEWTGTDAITMIRIRGRWGITSLTYVPEL